MTEIVLVKRGSAVLTEPEKTVARKVLFGAIDGLSRAHQKSWRRLMNWLLNKAEPGEMLELRTHRDRLGVFHRFHMAIEQSVFDAQERFEHFEQFRVWLKVGAGFVDWLPGPKGGVIPVPRSISYAALEQDDMERVHTGMLVFLRTPHAQKTLWPHLTPAQRADMVESVLAGFERQH